MDLQPKDKSNDPRFIIHPNDYNYLENLSQAVRNTKELELPIPDFEVDYSFCPDIQELGEFVLTIMRRAKYDKRLTEFNPAFNCIIYAQII
jgi:hypothetical protein